MKKLIVFLTLVFALFFSTLSHARLMETKFSGTLRWDDGEINPNWVIEAGIDGMPVNGSLIY
jgi:hypothetical protein